MSARGDLPRLDLILAADPGWERQETYRIRDWYAARWTQMGMRVKMLYTGNIRFLGASEHIHIPFWTETGGPLKRQCTDNFKVRPMRKYLRRIIGYHPSAPPHPPRGTFEQWLGITVDEWTRAKKSSVAYITCRHPLLELKMDRDHCTEWLEQRNLPIPPKSSCICCPYRRASEWKSMRDSSLEEWTQVVAFDEANRDNPLADRGSGADSLFVYRTGEPLATANLEADARREKQYYGTQMPLFACESGMCGT
jgi:hypothetical protein